MVKAILDGRKTQTRRVVKPHPHPTWTANYESRVRSGRQIDDNFIAGSVLHRPSERCPYGKPGDVLWVRETFCFDGENYIFKPNGKPYRWKPSIHMPKAAARIWLEITNVRVERLQDISNRDAMREGVESIDHGVHWRNYVKDEISCFIHPRHSFESLWKSINGSNWNRDWSLNPFVWVVEFKRIERP